MSWFKRQKAPKNNIVIDHNISTSTCNPVDLRRIKKLTILIAERGREVSLKIYHSRGYVSLEVAGRDIPESAVGDIMRELPDNGEKEAATNEKAKCLPAKQ